MSSDLYELSRSRMVEEQLIARGIRDERVLAAMGTLPRHRFVPELLESQAYSDKPVPIGGGQTISQPFVVAMMSESLQLQGEERVLEIGTGSGYQAAVLSRLCKQVFTVERLSTLLGRARQCFSALRLYNIRSQLSDGTLGWEEFAPFDAIIVTAGGPEIPLPLLTQLNEGGRLIMPVGERGAQELQLVEKRGGRSEVTVISPISFVDLIGEYGWQ